MKIVQLDASAYRVPTEAPEEDGTFNWDATTLILVEAIAENGQVWKAMLRYLRNAGRPGIASTALSAGNVALWDLKALSAGLPLFCAATVLFSPIRNGQA